jgi:hypothetical protein
LITSERIFLFEFKLNETAKVAIQCIKDRDYAAHLRDLNKPITGVGVVFSNKSKGVDDWDKEFYHVFVIFTGTQPGTGQVTKPASYV